MVCCGALRQTVHDASLQELHDCRTLALYREGTVCLQMCRWVLFLNGTRSFNVCSGYVVVKWVFCFPMSGSFHQRYVLVFQCLYHLRCGCSQWVALLNKTPPSHFNITRQDCSIPVHSRVTSWLMSRLFVWCGTTAKIEPSPSIFEVPRSHTIRHTHTHTRTRTHTLGFIWTSDQLVTGAAVYTAHDKHNRRTFIISAGFESADPRNRVAADLWLRRRGQWDGRWRPVTPHSSQVLCCRKQW
jgi:hypothetical protein